eukprot:4493426-Pleurochrysis_carterae.AAC.2
MRARGGQSAAEWLNERERPKGSAQGRESAGGRARRRECVGERASQCVGKSARRGEEDVALKHARGAWPTVRKGSPSSLCSPRRARRR